MTVTNTENRWEEVGNGVTTAFNYTNRIFAASDLKVFLDGNEEFAGFTVNGVGDPDGGNVTFDVAPANGVEVTIIREVANDQQTDYVEADPFPANSHEDGLDRRTIIAQQLADEIGRQLAWPKTEQNAPSPVLPDKASRANQVLGFDAAGAPIATQPLASGINASAFMQAVLDDPDADAARATLVALKSVLTAQGDLVMRGATTEQRLPVGENGQMLSISGGLPAWADRDYGPNFIDGFEISLATGTVTVKSGTCRTVTGELVSFTGPLTKNSTGAFAKGNNNDGYTTSSGLVGGTQIYFYLLREDATGDLDICFSSRETAALVQASDAFLPAGWTVLRMIAMAESSGSSDQFVPTESEVVYGHQALRMIFRDPLFVISANNPGTAAVIRTIPRLPDTYEPDAIMTWTLEDTTPANGNTFALFTHAVDQDDVVPDVNNHHMVLRQNGTVGQNRASIYGVFPTESAQIRTRISQSNVDITLVGILHGWFDHRRTNL